MQHVHGSETDKKIAGLRGGIAKTYDIDANLLRIVFVFLGIATGGVPLLVAYLVGWVLIPYDIRPV